MTVNLRVALALLLGASVPGASTSAGKNYSPHNMPDAGESFGVQTVPASEVSPGLHPRLHVPRGCTSQNCRMVRKRVRLPAHCQADQVPGNHQHGVLLRLSQVDDT